MKPVIESASRAAKWLILPVEVQHRELLTRVLLAKLAVERGYRVILGKDTVVRRLAPFLPKGILFDKSLGTARHGKPQRFARLGHTVVVLDEESTGYYGSPEQFLGVRLHDKTLSACTRWYCISDQMRDDAAARYRAHKDKFVTTGLPRTDLWRKEFQHLYRDDVERIRKEHGPFILFCSNFGGVIHARGDAFVHKQLKGQNKQYSAAEATTLKILEQGRPNLEAFVAVLKELPSAFPGHKIIVRPHPSESVSFWEKTVGQVAGVEVISEGVATSWILASDVMFHHGCTTGIEAEIMGHPQIMYAPHPDDHHDTEIMKTFSPMVKDKKALLARLDDAIKTGHVRARPLEEMEAYFAGITGEPVCERIMDDLDRIETGKAGLSRHLPLARFHPRMLIADLKPKSEKQKKYAAQKWPGTSGERLKNLLAQLTNDKTKPTPPQVSQIMPDLFLIEQG